MRRNFQIILVLTGLWCGVSQAPAGQASGRVLPDRAAEERTGGPVPVITSRPLAGRALPEFPHFEYLRTFNESDVVELAIDPERAPDLVGKTCDVFVVAARSGDAWNDDRTLTHAAAGSPPVLTFSASSMTANTFTLLPAYALSGATGTGPGVGYDVVLDCDRDGLLGPGDSLDGGGVLPGFWIVSDTTAAGPLAVTAIDYSVGSVFGLPATHRRQMTYYPSDLTGLGALPLVVIAHGNGHDYTWYDYLGFHLASYGYIVMSHQNDTCPGVENASSTTLGHTDALLDQQDSIAGGVLDGHVDGGRITWIGHSRGGEGILRAYDRIHDGHYTPVNYSIDDVILLASMAPTDFEGPAGTNPHAAPFHLLAVSGDDDVTGGPAVDRAKPFQIFERASGFRQATVVQGAGHGDLHGGDPDSVFDGPCHITPRSDVHAILKGTYLSLVEFYAKQNPAVKDFLWRPYDVSRPPGAPSGPCAVVSQEFRQQPTSAAFVIDDYESESSPTRSSSGGAVSFSVSHLVEGQLRDLDSSFDWNPNDPMNGMTRARSSEPWRGVVFDWSAPASYEYEIVGAKRDWTEYDQLSLRACQQTHHPETIAELGDLTFRVVLRDGSGMSSAVDIGTYGGGIVEPYQRDGGWANEFETIRLPLIDFTNDGNGLDLSDIALLSLEFGQGGSSVQGRIGLDSVEVTRDEPAPLPGALRFSLPEGVPEELLPGVATTLRVRLHASGESVLAGTLRIEYRTAPGPFSRLPLIAMGGGLYEATLPASGCADSPEFFVAAVGEESGVVTLPKAGAEAPFQAQVTRRSHAFADDFQSDQGWTTEVLGASAGAWERGTPVDATDWIFDPITDSDGSGRCYLTQNDSGNTDVDDGAVRLISPSLDLSHSDVFLGYDYFLRLTNEDGHDALVVEAESGDGNWIEVRRHDIDGGLAWRSVTISREALVAAGLTPSATTTVRYTVADASTLR